MKISLIGILTLALFIGLGGTAYACEKISWRIERAGNVILSSSSINDKEFELTFCAKKKRYVPRDIKSAIDFLVDALPKEYLEKIRTRYPNEEIDKIELNETLIFTDLSYTLEKRWKFSDIDAKKKYSALQKDAYRRGLYYNDFLFFEWLMHGVWQKVNDIPVNLGMQELNGILLEEDAKRSKAISFESVCQKAAFSRNRTTTFRFSSGFIRRIAFNYCHDTRRFYMYLFEMGWLPMEHSQVCYLSEGEILPKELVKECK